MVGVRVRVRVENMVGARVGTRVRIRIRARVTTHWPFWGFVPSLVRVRAMWLGTVLACSCCGASTLLHAMHVQHGQMHFVAKVAMAPGSVSAALISARGVLFLGSAPLRIEVISHKQLAALLLPKFCLCFGFTSPPSPIVC